jgi:CheY-like chemotaxis protein
MIRKSLGMGLGVASYHVDIADGYDLFSKWKAQSSILVCADLQMEKMDGLEFLREL